MQWMRKYHADLLVAGLALVGTLLLGLVVQSYLSPLSWHIVLLLLCGSWMIASLLLEKFLVWWARAKFDLYVYRGTYNGSQVTYTRVGGENCVVPVGQELVIRGHSDGVTEVVMQDSEPEALDEETTKNPRGENGR